MSYDITFNGKHSLKDMQLIRVNSKEHKHPSKIKIKETIPFMSGEYDFSSLYGGACYSERTLNYTFFVEVEAEEEMNYKKIIIENWLLGTNGKTQLTDDDLIGYYYLAECIDIDFDNYYSFGFFDVTFEAYPFKISENYEGADIWDTFNFETDVSQDVSFTITDYKEVTLYNKGITNVVPQVICSGSMQIIKDGITYNFKAGANKDYSFILKKGNNNINIVGNGNIEFVFKIEVI